MEELEAKPDPEFEYPALDEIEEKLKLILPTHAGVDEETIKRWYVNLYRTDALNQFRDLVKTNGDGKRDVSLLIAHNYFIETVIKVFKTKRTAGELLLSRIIKDADAIEKAKLQEEDKKYKPRFAEREKEDKAKQTAEEKKIREFVEKFGLSRESAEKIVFKNSTPAENIAKTPSEKALKLGLSQEDINKLILGK